MLLNPEPKKGLTNPDEVPEFPDEALTQPGDLWILGEHQLLCGHNSKAGDTKRWLGAPFSPGSNPPSFTQNSDFASLPETGTQYGNSAR